MIKQVIFTSVRQNNEKEWIQKISRPMTKQTKWHVHPAKTQISLSVRPVWSESSLSACRNLVSWASHWAQSEDSDQTGWMPRLIWVFAGRTVILLVLSWGGSDASICFPQYNRYFKAYQALWEFNHFHRTCLDLVDNIHRLTSRMLWLGWQHSQTYIAYALTWLTTFTDLHRVCFDLVDNIHRE